MTDQKLMARQPASADDALPLCVDLDETFCKVDTLWEVAMRGVRHHPLRLAGAIARFPFHGSRSRFKAELSRLGGFDASHLPIRTEVRDYVQAARSAGRRTLLVTGADQAIAEAVAAAHPYFDEVHGSGNGVNLKSRNKAAWLVGRFGRGGYEYVGDCGADVPVWKSAGVARVVAFGGRVPVRLSRRVPGLLGLPVPARPSPFKILRPHQWVKNLLVFVPLLAAHRGGEISLWVTASLAFFATSLTASAVYVLNDFLDVPEDRGHPEKRRRLIASGDIHFTTAVGLAVGCLLAAAALASRLPFAFWEMLGIYVATAFLYALGIKRLPVIDLIVLTGLYCLRLFLGGAAMGIDCSVGLVFLAVGVFGSLATMKRCAELSVWTSLGRDSAPGRGYPRGVQPGLVVLGGVLGLLAIGVLPFYIQGEVARDLYSHPSWLLGLVPLLAIGLVSMWREALSGRLKGDPVAFALKRPLHYLLGAGAIAFIWLAVR